MSTMRDAWGSLTPSWITTFLAVAEELNFTRAGAALHLTQPAVSRQMQALRRAVGMPLVEQLGRRMVLTDAGRALQREALRLQGDLSRAGEVMAGLRGGLAGRLRVGASSAPGLYLLPRALGSFLARRPDVELSFRLANTLAIEEALLAGELDLGFVGGHLASAELAAEPLVDDEVLVYAARSHPLAAARSLEPARLGGQSFVLREPGSATRRAFEAWLAARGIEPGRVIELACPEAIKRLVEAGLGLGIASCHGLQARGGALRVLHVRGLAIRRQLLVARHRDKAPGPLADELVRAVRRSTRPCARDGRAHGA